MTARIRLCPLCSGEAVGTGFPFAITFADQIFRYYRCGQCGTVYVDPIPDEDTFAQMYEKTSYHDAYYAETDLKQYFQAAGLISEYAQRGSSILDFGCGLGYFLQAVKVEGFLPYGVEFDKSAAAAAAASVGCPVYTVADLQRKNDLELFDVLHLGDVLEHLPDPCSTVVGLLKYLKPGGLLFVEGPIEANPSPVYWCSRLFGELKRSLSPGLVGPGVPMHLFRTSAKAQSAFFKHRFPELRLLYWHVSESGWPYAGNHGVKRRIADVAIALGGRSVLGQELGNRFRALYRLSPVCS